MLTKACGNPACLHVITAMFPSQLRRRKYCGHRCANRMTGDALHQGLRDRGLQRACWAIHTALGITAPPSADLVAVVRRLRRTAYQAGWAVIVGKVRRAVARGVLVRRERLEGRAS